MNATVLVYPGVDELDAVGPYAVLSRGARMDPSLGVALASMDGEAVRAAGGALLTPDRRLHTVGAGDMLVVPGGGWNARTAEGAHTQASNAALLDSIRESRRAGAVMAGVCTGAMILAHAGVLDGHTVVTHAGAIDDLRAFDVTVADDARVVDDGDVITCGGVTSGIDLALHVLQRWLGSDIAGRVASAIEYRPDQRVLRSMPERGVDLAAAAAGVVLDLDGTLIDSVYERTVAWREAFAALDVFPPAWRLHRLVGLDGRVAVQAIAAELGLPPWSDEEAAAVRGRYAAAYRRLLPGVRPLPGAVELLEALDRAGKPWAVATTASTAAAEEALRILGAPGAAVVTGEEVTAGKPDPAILAASAARLGVPLERTVVVGDTAWDMTAARRGGADAVGVLTGGWPREELLAAGARAVVEGVHDLLVGPPVA